MPFLYIPPLGTELTLANDWTFNLHNEYRNETLIAALAVQFPKVSYWDQNKQFHSVTLPAGLPLKVDRIYIRSGQSGFDSMTFSVLAKHVKNRSWPNSRISGGLRFWTSLEDANKLEFVVDESTPLQKEVAANLAKSAGRKAYSPLMRSRLREYLLDTIGQHSSTAINFDSMDVHSFHVDALTDILRITESMDGVVGWSSAAAVAYHKHIALGMTPPGFLHILSA